MPREPYKTSPLVSAAPSSSEYRLAGHTVADLTNALITAHSAEPLADDDRRYLTIQPEVLTIGKGVFGRPSSPVLFPAVTVSQQPDGLRVSCSCEAPKDSLCEHQTLVLLALAHRRELQVFFDAGLRREQLLPTARLYGLENEANLDAHFSLQYTNQKLEVAPKQSGLYPITADTQLQLAAALLPPPGGPVRPTHAAGSSGQRIIVLGKHKYYDYLTVHLFEAALTAGGKPKNPLVWVHPLDASLASNDLAEVRFYTGISKLQQPGERSPEADWDALRAVVSNPLGLLVFTSSAPVSEKTLASSLAPLTLCLGQVELQLTVETQGLYYAVAGSVVLNGLAHDLRLLPIRYGSFVALHDTWYLLDRPEVLRVAAFFKTRGNALLLHESQFKAFQQAVLTKLEHSVPIIYADILPATPEQVEANGFAMRPEKLLYLSDSEAYVDLVPVMKYGELEVPVLSRRIIYATDPVTRKAFSVPRDKEVELQFAALLVRQHPDFEEQLGREALYMPRRQFLDEDWFLNAFYDWQQAGITVLGFNELKNNKLNPHKASISIRVGTEANWFDTELIVRFGGKKVPLAAVHRAIRNKSKYVQLGDGTRGILPQEWLDRFARYFAAGEVVGERIRTPKINFSAISTEYELEALTDEARAELALYQAQVVEFGGIEPVAAPAALRGTLRPYQLHGLSWLHFLDKFSFGGCLADDMGLGKTITVLAFLLAQRAKNPGGVNLVVVPTSLVFNWQAEAVKFAPTLRLFTLHGPSRPQNTADFAGCDLVLTTYGTLLADIAFLKDFRFNYIVLDESQAIKNPESQRYHAVRLLQARNRIVLTGTPIENNTYDLYGQLSFACPGLLGSQQHFKDQYATPIDKFKSERHAQALRQKIKPFVLRRTKQQVAAELPLKTEMVLHCEMGEEQRRVYDHYKKEYRDMLMGLHTDPLAKERLHILQGITRMRQICNSPALLRDEFFYGTASAKLERLVQEIENKAGQHKILVFSQFVGMLNLIRPALTAQGIATAYLTGQTKNRAAVVNSFQQDPAVRVFLISLKAGGVGLNLTEADYVYIVDPWWNPAVENQAIDRSHRLGQTKPVVAVRLICPGTIEEKIQDLQQSKKELASGLIRTDAAILKSLSRTELLDLFS